MSPDLQRDHLSPGAGQDQAFKKQEGPAGTQRAAFLHDVVAAASLPAMLASRPAPPERSWEQACIDAWGRMRAPGTLPSPPARALQIKLYRKDIAELLRNGKQDYARIRVEAILRENSALQVSRKCALGPGGGGGGGGGGPPPPPPPPPPCPPPPPPRPPPPPPPPPQPHALAPPTPGRCSTSLQALEILELYLELVAVRAPLIQATKEVPRDMVGAGPHWGTAGLGQRAASGEQGGHAGCSCTRWPRRTAKSLQRGAHRVAGQPCCCPPPPPAGGGHQQLPVRSAARARLARAGHAVQNGGWP